MKHGKDVDVQFLGPKPTDWVIDGSPVVEYWHEENYIVEDEQTTDVLWLKTANGSEYPLWQPIGV